MTIKTWTKLTFLIILATITIIPILVWAITNRSLEGVGGFVAATTGPLGVLTAAMAAKSISRDVNQP